MESRRGACSTLGGGARASRTVHLATGVRSAAVGRFARSLVTDLTWRTAGRLVGDVAGHVAHRTPGDARDRSRLARHSGNWARRAAGATDAASVRANEVRATTGTIRESIAGVDTSRCSPRARLASRVAKIRRGADLSSLAGDARTLATDLVHTAHRAVR